MLAVNYEFNEKRLMARQLRVDLIKPDAKEGIGFIQGAKTLIGREPDEGGIAVPSQSVSRNHGIFVRLRTHWFYKDTGSTNGSWINGKPAREGEWKLVRGGDILQLADAAVAIKSESDAQFPHNRLSGFPALGGITLIVFSKGEFVDEFPVPDFGRALVIGGSQGDLQVEGTLEESPNLIIERRSMNVCAYAISKSLTVLHNDAEMKETTNLNDRDEIRIGHFLIIFNNPESAHKSLNIGDRPEVSGASGTWKEWSSADKSPDYRVHEKEDIEQGRSRHTHGISVSAFGRTDDDSIGYDETVAISEEEAEQKIAGFDMHPSRRYAMEEEPDNEIENLDEKIVFIVGIVLLLGLIALMIYWLLG